MFAAMEPDQTVFNVQKKVMARVATLEQEADWDKWTFGLKNALTAMQQDYWGILTGENPYPDLPVSMSYTDAEAVDLIAKRDNKSTDEVTLHEIAVLHMQTASENINVLASYRVHVDHWNKNHDQAYELLKLTLGPRVLPVIEGIGNAHVAYRKLQEVYGPTSWRMKLVYYSKWTSLRYEKVQTPTEFVSLFRKTLDDYMEYVPESLPYTIQLMQFLQAVQENPKAARFLQSLKLDRKSDQSMIDIYIKFLLCK